MKIKREREFKPVTITLETVEDYQAFVAMLDEAESVPKEQKQYMDDKSIALGVKLSNFFSGDIVEA